MTQWVWKPHTRTFRFYGSWSSSGFHASWLIHAGDSQSCGSIMSFWNNFHAMCRCIHGRLTCLLVCGWMCLFFLDCLQSSLHLRLGKCVSFTKWSSQPLWQHCAGLKSWSQTFDLTGGLTWYAWNVSLMLQIYLAHSSGKESKLWSCDFIQKRPSFHHLVFSYNTHI